MAQCRFPVPLRHAFGVFGRALFNFALPDSCLHCDAPLQAGEICLCPDCARSLTLDAGELPPAPVDGGRADVETAAAGPAFAAPYEGALRTLIRGLKFEDRPDAAPLIARLLSELLAVRLGEPERGRVLLVPVPLHRTRRRERGYDQARLLVEALGTRDGYDVDAALLARVRATRPQTRLPRRERLLNLGDSFSVTRRPPPGRAIILVDDVVTTGATLAVATAALARAGVGVRLAAAAAGARTAGIGETEARTGRIAHR
jgi:ComF family protein